MFKAMNMMMMA